MNELNKRLHGLRAVLREDGKTISMQKIDAENILLIAESGMKSIRITATVSQLQQMLNRLDLWESMECEKI